MIEGDEKSVEWKSKSLKELAGKFSGQYTGENVAKHSYMSSSSFSIYLRVSFEVII